MRIVLLHVPDCPNLERARIRLREALDVVGLDASTEEAQVETTTLAAATGLRGSPTFLVDGVDAFPTPFAEPSLSCRLIRTPNGLEGTPTAAKLVEVLSR